MKDKTRETKGKDRWRQLSVTALWADGMKRFDLSVEAWKNAVIMKRGRGKFDTNDSKRNVGKCLLSADSRMKGEMQKRHTDTRNALHL